MGQENFATVPEQRRRDDGFHSQGRRILQFAYTKGCPGAVAGQYSG